ncbi:tetratricopeptide repeat protein [Helicobacter cetorum]|uniref:tetratricopeptide repeat protein n=1 Tax=Helicobacter cetorum TaxID=138563 RepID=UPI000CF1B713|nr:tetratricopeptide repeat protein [Helicobacter cetorum]
MSLGGGGATISQSQLNEGIQAYQQGNYGQAYPFLKKGCDANNAIACRALASMYASRMVNKMSKKESLEMAVITYKKACEQLNDIDACEKFGEWYSQLIKIKFEESRKSLISGTLGFAFLLIPGMGRVYKKSKMSVVEPSIQKACKVGRVKSCNILAQFARDKKDYLEELSVYQTACSFNGAEGCYSLGNAYLSGRKRWRIKKDKEKAMVFFQKACNTSLSDYEVGSAGACAKLGDFYKKKNDLGLSSEYCQMARSKGYAYSCGEN